MPEAVRDEYSFVTARAADPPFILARHVLYFHTSPSITFLITHRHVDIRMEIFILLTAPSSLYLFASQPQPLC